ncbi:MAG TPA: SBBP repeat-containing protein [Anaeromyxobacter sp.]|nr:SBBP repeat-containing protein [Anaeromyxobacter sp.]
MNFHMLRGFVAALLALEATAASAHELECRTTAGILRVGPDGLPALGAGGLPQFLATPSPVLVLRSYPALVGFRVEVENLASEPSVVTGVTDTLLAALGASPQIFGDAIAPGLALPVGASATRVVAVAVGSQEECLRLFGGAPAEAPVCAESAESRFAVEHDVGSAECRARVVCAAPPANGCGDRWRGIQQLGPGGGGDDIALEGACDVAVVGSESGILAYLARLDAGGARTQHVTFSRGRQAAGRAVAVDAAGNRWVASDQQIESNIVQAHVSRFAPDGTETLHDVVVGGPRPNGPPGSTFAGAIAVDRAGNAYLVGSSVGPLPGFASAGGHGVFVLKIDGATGARAWALELGSSTDGDRAEGAAVDSAGNVFVAGSTPGAMPGNESAGHVDVFVARIAPDGTLARLVQLGTAGFDAAKDVALDAAGDLYVAGQTSGALPGNVPPVNVSDAFLARLLPDLSPVWYRQLGVAGAFTAAEGVAAGAAGEAWIAGRAQSGGLDALSDAFVARFDGDGNLAWSTPFGLPGGLTIANAVAVDAEGNAYVTGRMGEVAKITSTFVAKVDPSGGLK